jgi:hypothetical protein
MSSKYNNTDTFINRVALGLSGLGLILLLLKIGSVVYIRLNGKGVFGEGFLDSSADSYRFIAYVGLILVGGLIYSFGGFGRALSEAVGAIVMWQILSWYSNYQSLTSITGFWQWLDVALFALIFLIMGVLLVYLPYRFLASFTHRSRSSRSPRLAR